MQNNNDIKIKLVTNFTVGNNLCYTIEYKKIRPTKLIPYLKSLFKKEYIWTKLYEPYYHEKINPIFWRWNNLYQEENYYDAKAYASMLTLDNIKSYYKDVKKEWDILESNLKKKFTNNKKEEIIK